MSGRKRYLKIDVLTAARRRVAAMFDAFDRVVVSTSGGKDSTVLLHLVHAEAQQRGQQIDVFFLDQEAEYQATIDLMRVQMALPMVRPHWYQVPVLMTNATSSDELFLRAWHPDERDQWLRPHEPNAVTVAPDAPDRFYPLLEWVESRWGERTAVCVGLRADESPQRFRAVTRSPAYRDWRWTSVGKGGATRCYPIYDWAFRDVWAYIGQQQIPYNRIYDYQWAAQRPERTMRVSNLIHEHAYTCLTDLAAFEPDTYAALSRRLAGVRTAARYAAEPTIYRAGERPAAFATWAAYRAFLLAQQSPELRSRYQHRFAQQPQTESVYRQQCTQLLLNDVEGSVAVRTRESALVARKAQWAKEL
jgi:predicted phosphoadenosine phosphosulfate sulfurtransferase